MIKLVTGSGEDLPGVPALTFRFPGSGLINYLALPIGREAAPFLEMLARTIPSGADISEDLKSRLRELKRPVDILVFIASACPNCPHAVRAANMLALISKKIKTTIIDAEVFSEVAERFKIRSVPMTLLDGEFLFYQVVPAENLALKILSRDTDGYMEEAFLSQITTGNIELAVKRLLDHPKAEASFLSVWEKSTLSIRMGLLLVAEQALDQNPDILDSIVHRLIALLSTEDISFRGDTADLLGQIGHPEAKESLEALLQSDNPDIVEIVEEALKSLKTEKS
ncbi:MAG: hypothetical protein GTO29_14655 [Candidatus Latescibacteria bacterium]|nr:hypothetical protein [Candidatus Latescibacterota bacterium]NIO57390.1 hypothetical protein [Candidatus Latescibacterota bacterium]